MAAAFDSNFSFNQQLWYYYTTNRGKIRSRYNDLTRKFLAYGQNVFLKSEYIFAFPFRFVQTAQNNNKKPPHIAQLGMYGGFGD